MEDKDIIANRDELTLEIDDKEFIEIAESFINDTKTHNESELRLNARRKENEKHYLGKQHKDIKYKKYQAPFLDNILYDSIAYQKPMALSRFPDFIVTEGQEGVAESIKTAEDLTEVINSETKTRKVRKAFGLAFKHRPVYFIGGIKVFWNPEKGQHGDWDLRVVHPKNLTLDRTAMEADVNQMGFLSEDIEWSVKDWIMRFPKKKEEFLKILRSKGIVNQVGDPTEAQMNTKIKGREFWFVDYKKKGEGHQRKVGVAWYIKEFNLLFEKMDHPYWDWTGEETTYNYAMKQPKEEELRESLFDIGMGGQGMPLLNETTFKNYMDKPEFPYILFAYDQWGEGPLDITSDLEQNILLQQHYDKRGMQTTDMLNRARGKNVWSGADGAKTEDIEKFDPANPDQDMFVPDGDLSKIHKYIPGEQPSVQMLNDKIDLRNRIYDKMGINGSIRGETDANTATQEQIGREGAFGKMDDVVEETINTAAEKLAEWIMQFMKLFYTEEHFKKTLGADGKAVHHKITQDLVEDGMEVHISASGTDKLRAEQRATDMAKLGFTDPISYYKDLNIPDPIGRARKLTLWMTDPMMYMQMEIEGRDVPAQVDALNGDGATEASQAIMMIQGGQVPPPPQIVGEGYMQTFSNFMQSGEVEAILQQFPQIKEQLLAFAEAVMQIYQQSQGSSLQPMGGTPPSVSGQSGGGPVGPTATQPSPTNTSRVAVNPPTPNVSMV